ncbi:hypothetical protein CJJ23_00035 [Mycoplasmopsis agassizii]|uniref:Lipoprotein-associated type-17 domain-containing protein n=1 Tax=Mycoplasmopsis agassizii TaxID=33922 RepID=A0A269TJQ2_9BACT|nr:hypothetical protein [Mycoplasmopsis agassizii]PAK21722.1 hypothetical protein CJJ23_00035 [Mycoplasmopsis agassizii]
MKKTKKLLISFAVLAGLSATVAAVACSTSIINKEVKTELNNNLNNTPVITGDVVQTPVEVKTTKPVEVVDQVSINQQKESTSTTTKTKVVHHADPDGADSEDDWTEESNQATAEFQAIEKGLIEVFGSNKTIELKDFKQSAKDFIEETNKQTFKVQLTRLLEGTTLTKEQKDKVQELLSRRIFNMPVMKNLHLVENKPTQATLRLLFSFEVKGFKLDFTINGFLNPNKKVEPKVEVQLENKVVSTQAQTLDNSTKKDDRMITVSIGKPVDDTPFMAIPLPDKPQPEVKKPSSIYVKHPLWFAYLPNGNQKLVASLATRLDKLAKATTIRLKNNKSVREYYELFSKLNPSDSLVNLFDEHSQDFANRGGSPSFSDYGYMIAKTKVKNIKWIWNHQTVSNPLSVEFTLFYNDSDHKFKFNFVTASNKLDDLQNIKFDLSKTYEVRQPGIDGETDSSGNLYRSSRAVSSRKNVYEFMTKFSRSRGLQTNMTMLGDFLANANLTAEQWKIVRLIQSVPITGSALEFTENDGNTTDTFDIVLRYGKDHKVFRLKVKIAAAKHWYSHNVEPLFNYVDFEILKEFITKVNERMVLKRKISDTLTDWDKFRRDTDWSYMSHMFTINTPHDGRIEDIFRPTSKNFDPKPVPTSWNPISIIKNMHIKNMRYYETQGSHQILRMNPYFTKKNGIKTSRYAHMGQSLYIIVDRWQEEGPDIQNWY